MTVANCNIKVLHGHIIKVNYNNSCELCHQSAIFWHYNDTSWANNTHYELKCFTVTSQHHMVSSQYSNFPSQCCILTLNSESFWHWSYFAIKIPHCENIVLQCVITVSCYNNIIIYCDITCSMLTSRCLTVSSQRLILNTSRFLK